MSKHEGIIITEYNDGTINVDVNCTECGKPITVANDHGMFCEDRCGEEESKSYETLAKTMIDDMCKAFGR
jgi:hypothetical protein